MTEWGTTEADPITSLSLYQLAGRLADDVLLHHCPTDRGGHCTLCMTRRVGAVPALVPWPCQPARHAREVQRRLEAGDE